MLLSWHQFPIQQPFASVPMSHLIGVNTYLSFNHMELSNVRPCLDSDLSKLYWFSNESHGSQADNETG